MSIRSIIRESLIVGDSPDMAAVLEAIEEIAEGDAPVLIEGERGTGRELVARAIHYAGPRRAGDFVSVKAATIPRPLIDEEMLGAPRRARGGTLLLKDVGSLPRGPQRQLARVLRRRERARPGGEKESKDKDRDRDRDRDREDTGELIDVRVIGASDSDLGPAVAADTFDRELYDRLGARKVIIPPLRRRIADIPRLAVHFMKHVAAEAGRGRLSLSARAVDRLQKYPWPGNVAELKDVARKLVLRTRGGQVEAGDVDAVLPEVAERVPLEDMAFEELVRSKLRGFLRRVDGYPVERLYDDVIARVERPLLALVLEHTGGNQLRAADMLGLNRNTLRKKLAELGLAAKGDGPNDGDGERDGTGRPRRRK